MKFLCVYVDSGKGHFIPAKTIQTSLEGLGHKADIINFFELTQTGFVGRINQKIWRGMLKYVRFGNWVTKISDQKSNAMKDAVRIYKRHRRKVVKNFLEEGGYDAIFTTHPYASAILSNLVSYLDFSIPVYYYATDVFTVPRAAVSPYLRRLYVPTEEGRQAAISYGLSEDKVVLSPFPLQQNVKESRRYTKAEARALLGLEELFTIQLNLGGEGLGSVHLIEELDKIGFKLQVVVLGGLNEEMKWHFESMRRRLSGNVKLVVAGFVKNVNEYLLASDLVVGRSGINTLLEAFYAHRPFLITELVYTVIPSADYVERYHVGWNAEGDMEKQVGIIKNLLENPGLLDEMDQAFKKLPISFDPDAFASLIVEDTLHYRQEHNLS